MNEPATSMPLIDWQDFTKIELRVGTILEVMDFPEARRPAWKEDRRWRPAS